MEQTQGINRDRVLPLVGEHFKTKTFGLLTITAGFDVADALLRTGVKQLFVFKDTSSLSERSRLSHHARMLGEHIRVTSEGDKCDLLLGVGDATHLLTFRSHIRRMQTEGLFLLLFGSSYALVYMTGTRSSLGHLGECELTETHGIIRMEGLGLFLRAVKAWVLRDTPLDDKTFNSLWEHQLWVKSPNTTRPVKSILSHFEPDREPEVHLSSVVSMESVLENKVIWVVGVGTGSLVANMLRTYPLKSLLLWDGKPFSEFNVVRQDVYPNEVGGKIKSEVLATRYAEESKYDDPRTKVKQNLHAIVEAISKESLEEALQTDTVPRPDLVIVATGETQMLNHEICAVLREHKIPYIVPSALPSASYLKFIVSFSNGDVCYSCLQGKQTIDVEQPTMNTQARELFYGGTQPATLFETYPSAYRLMELVYQMLVKPVFRSEFFRASLREHKNCFLQANTVENTDEGVLYGLGIVGEVKSFGVGDLRSWKGCNVCGRTNGEGSVSPCLHCKEKPRSYGEFCSSKHAMLYAMEEHKIRKTAIETHAALLGEPGLD